MVRCQRCEKILPEEETYSTNPFLPPVYHYCKDPCWRLQLEDAMDKKSRPG